MNPFNLHIKNPSIAKKDLSIREIAFRSGVHVNVLYLRMLKFWIAQHQRDSQLRRKSLSP